jgi:hypothetical protein
MYLATRHAIYSAALGKEATANFMFLPSWNKRTTTSPYASLYCRFPRLCIGLHTIRPTTLCRSTFLEQHTDAPSQTHLGDACTSLPYEILKVEIASMLATKAG